MVISFGKIEVCFYKILILGRFAHWGWARRSLAFQVSWEAAVSLTLWTGGVAVSPPAWKPGLWRSGVEGVGNPQSRLSLISQADSLSRTPGQYFSDCVSKTQLSEQVLQPFSGFRPTFAPCVGVQPKIREPAAPLIRAQWLATVTGCAGSAL